MGSSIATCVRAGVLIRHAQRLGVPVPCHRLLHALVSSKISPVTPAEETSAEPLQAAEVLRSVGEAPFLPASLHYSGRSALMGEQARSFSTASMAAATTDVLRPGVVGHEMELCTTVGGVRRFREQCRDRRLGFVPTMGGLHDGKETGLTLSFAFAFLTCSFGALALPHV